MNACRKRPASGEGGQLAGQLAPIVRVLRHKLTVLSSAYYDGCPCQGRPLSARRLHDCLLVH